MLDLELANAQEQYSVHLEVRYCPALNDDPIEVPIVFDHPAVLERIEGGLQEIIQVAELAFLLRWQRHDLKPKAPADPSIPARDLLLHEPDPALLAIREAHLRDEHAAARVPPDVIHAGRVGAVEAQLSQTGAGGASPSGVRCSRTGNGNNCLAHCCRYFPPRVCTAVKPPLWCIQFGWSPQNYPGFARCRRRTILAPQFLHSPCASK